MTNQVEPEAGFEDDDGFAEVPHRVSEAPTISYPVRFNRDTVARSRSVADARAIGVTQLVRQWVRERFDREQR